VVRLGVRLLSESLARTGAVARRAADEAIIAATKALELSRGLVALDFEVQKEREKMAAKQRGFDEEDGNDENLLTPRGRGGDPPGDPSSRGAAEEPDTARSQTSGAGDAGAASKSGSKPPQPENQLRSAAKRVKDRHVALRVKNLHFLSGLNDEVLRLQLKLRSLLERSEGALLPEISVLQKKGIFDLVMQLLDSGVVHAERLSLSTVTPACKVLERAFAFVVALEQAQEVALPVEVRTQALKLATLIDADLLCQIIDGPFKKRLSAIGAKRRAEPAGIPAMSREQRGRVRSNSAGAGLGGGAAKAWEEAVRALCSRIVCGLRAPIAAPREASAAAAAATANAQEENLDVNAPTAAASCAGAARSAEDS